MPVWVPQERIAGRATKDAGRRNSIGRERLMRPPDGMAIAEQFEVRGYVGRIHRQDLDLYAIEAVERNLGWAPVQRALPSGQSKSLVKSSACREVSHRNRGVVDPHNSAADPCRIRPPREFKQFERMAFGITKLDGGHTTR